MSGDVLLSAKICILCKKAQIGLSESHRGAFFLSVLWFSLILQRERRRLKDTGKRVQKYRIKFVIHQYLVASSCILLLMIVSGKEKEQTRRNHIVTISACLLFCGIGNCLESNGQFCAFYLRRRDSRFEIVNREIYFLIKNDQVILCWNSRCLGKFGTFGLK